MARAARVVSKEKVKVNAVKPSAVEGLRPAAGNRKPGGKFLDKTNRPNPIQPITTPFCLLREATLFTPNDLNKHT